MRKEIVKVLASEKKVMFQDGGAEPYDTLLIASGAKPVTPTLEGLPRSDYLVFHTMEDYHRLAKSLDGGRDVAIYGGGLVATELAASLLEKGLSVKLIMRSRLLRAYLDEELGEFVEKVFRSRGAQLLERVEIREAHKVGDRDVELLLSDGSREHTAVLVACLGVRPNIDFLRDSGVRTSTGVLVDGTMKTNVESIWAAGDVAEAVGFFSSQPEVIPTLHNALAQGKVAGANMAEELASYEGSVRNNVFSFFGNLAFSCGLATLGEDDAEVVTQRSDDGQRVKKLVFRDGKLVGGAFLNHPEIDPGVILYLIRKKLDVASKREMLLAKTREVSRQLMLDAERRGTSLR